MATLRFEGKAVLELLEHSRNAPKHEKPYEPGVDPGPGLFLVKDTGIYLMSNGEPGKLIGKGPQNVVVYAEGYGKNADHGDIQAAVGGDDFVELVLDDKTLKTLKADETLVIELTKKHMKVMIERVPRRKK